MINFLLLEIMSRLLVNQENHFSHPVCSGALPTWGALWLGSLRKNCECGPLSSNIHLIAWAKAEVSSNPVHTFQKKCEDPETYLCGMEVCGDTDVLFVGANGVTLFTSLLIIYTYSLTYSYICSIYFLSWLPRSVSNLLNQTNIIILETST